MVGFGILAVTASACQSTEQESAKLAREGQLTGSGPLRLGPANRLVRVSDATLLSGGGRTAVAVRLTSSATRPQADVPLLVNVTGGGGRVLYTNGTAGLEASLQHVPLLLPHRSAWWVDDQVLISQRAAGVSVRVGSGSGSRASAGGGLATSAPHMRAQGGAGVLSARLLARGVPPHGVALLSAVALKGGRVVAAGRATVESGSARAGASTPFQIFLIGEPAGAKIELSAVWAGGKPTGG